MSENPGSCPHCGRDKRRAVIGRRGEVPCYWCGLLPSAAHSALLPPEVLAMMDRMKAKAKHDMDATTLQDVLDYLRELRDRLRFKDQEELDRYNRVRWRLEALISECAQRSAESSPSGTGENRISDGSDATNGKDQ